MTKNKKIIAALIIIIIIIIFATVAALGFISVRNREKAQAVVREQVILQAQKEKEEKARLQEQKNIEEKKKADEKKKLEEQHKLAVAGIGSSNRIPVLMYHSIAYEKGNELRIPKEKFRDQMKYLKDSGYNPISLEELYSHMAEGSKLPDKPVVITFDDGYEDNYINAFPVLKEFGFKAVVFMITSEIDDGSDYMTSDQLKEMDKGGVNIESHTVTHPKLNELSYEDQVKELKDSKATLEKLLNREVKYAAYPYGKFNDNTLRAVESLGYKMAFSTQTGLAEKSNGIYKLHRIYVSNNHSMQKFKQFLEMK